MPTIQDLSIDIATIAALTDEEREVCVPWSGTWRMIAAVFTPATTVGADANDYITITLKKGAGGTSIGSIATSATANTKGTPRSFTLSGGAALDFAGGTDCIEIATVNTGATGVVVDGSFSFAFEKVAGS